MLGTAEMSWSLRTCKTKRTVANSSTCKTRNVITKVRQDQKFCNSLNVVVWHIPWVVTGCVIHFSFVLFFMPVYELVQRADADHILKLNSVSKRKTWSLVSLCLESLPNGQIHNEVSCFCICNNLFFT